MEIYTHAYICTHIHTYTHIYRHSEFYLAGCCRGACCGLTVAEQVGPMEDARAGSLARRLHRKHSRDLGVWSHSNIKGIQVKQRMMLDTN